MVYQKCTNEEENGKKESQTRHKQEQANLDTSEARGKSKWEMRRIKTSIWNEIELKEDTMISRASKS